MFIKIGSEGVNKALHRNNDGENDCIFGSFFRICQHYLKKKDLKFGYFPYVSLTWSVLHDGTRFLSFFQSEGKVIRFLSSSFIETSGNSRCLSAYVCGKG